MFILYIAALAIMLDKGANRWFRFWALGVAPMALALDLPGEIGDDHGARSLARRQRCWVTPSCGNPPARVRHMRLLIVDVRALCSC